MTFPPFGAVTLLVWHVTPTTKRMSIIIIIIYFQKKKKVEIKRNQVSQIYFQVSTNVLNSNYTDEFVVENVPL